MVSVRSLRKSWNTDVVIRTVRLLLNDVSEGVQCAWNDVHRVEPLSAVRFLGEIVEETDDGVANTEVVPFLAKSIGQ